NCSTTITNTSSLPKQFGWIGHCDSSNFDGGCLCLAAGVPNRDGSYTHICCDCRFDRCAWRSEFGFLSRQSQQFLAIPERNIISIGGWAFATELGMSNNLREALQEANHGTIATNLARCFRDKKFDGVDFYWEYPGVFPLSALVQR
ncbi:uncharacterized protein CC84DRAFT_1103946, partial [Paraphaeosphaeria sporulosa]